MVTTSKASSPLLEGLVIQTHKLTGAITSSVYGVSGRRHARGSALRSSFNRWLRIALWLLNLGFRDVVRDVVTIVGFFFFFSSGGLPECIITSQANEFALWYDSSRDSARTGCEDEAFRRYQMYKPSHDVVDLSRGIGSFGGGGWLPLLAMAVVLSFRFPPSMQGVL